nr:hypothetical protein [Tanacetum cinerariifolium]
MDNVFQADKCDAFDSDVDEAPTTHTMFMENLSFADPVYDEAGSSYDSDILFEEMDSILEDSVDEDNLAGLNDNLVDTMPEMFIDKHALDYSSLPLYDEYDDDIFKVESNTEYVYDDPFYSKG